MPALRADDERRGDGRPRLDEALSATPAGIAAVLAAAAVLVLRPARLRIPSAVLYAGLVVMWVFQLARYSVV